ncbi:MAG: hypothetical protein U0166_02050 [Acidobacteriota bacterium]
MRDRNQLRTALLVGVLVLFAAPLMAQAPPAPAPAPATDSGLAQPPDPKTEEILQQAAQGDEQTLTAAGFTYDPKGRRDPFESIFDKKKDNKGRPTGVRGMEISELDLQGIVISGADKYAIVSGTDSKGYNLREGDELFNGKVKTIEKDRVVFLQKVNDPLSIKEYTEVAKRLNPEDR